MKPIKVLVADDHEDIRTTLRILLSGDPDIEVIGEARDGVEALQRIKALNPDIVLMDIYMPKMDGISATERLYLEHPECAVIVMSTEDERDCLAKAMMAGARGYQSKPFKQEELLDNIKRVYQLESKRSGLGTQKKGTFHKPHLITVFGTKGGVGKTTIAVNLAVLLAATKKKVALVDLDLQFGDVSVFLNLTPKRTIAELVQEGEHLDIEIIESYLIAHVSGIKVLSAPSRPEYAELITTNHVEKIIAVLKTHYDYVVIDTPPHFSDTNLCAIELSSQILLVMSLDLATLKNVKLSLELLDSLHQKGKTKLILNRASEESGIKVKDAEEMLSFLTAEQVPNDSKLAITALNRGVPFVISSPSAKVSRSLNNIAQLVINDQGYQEDLQKLAQKKGILAGFISART